MVSPPLRISNQSVDLDNCIRISEGSYILSILFYSILIFSIFLFYYFLFYYF
ncbi:unnamed protein product, partial [Staurois parvus]